MVFKFEEILLYGQNSNAKNLSADDWKIIIRESLLIFHSNIQFKWISEYKISFSGNLQGCNSVRTDLNCWWSKEEIEKPHRNYDLTVIL